MKYILAGHFGNRDTPRVGAGPDERVTSVDFISPNGGLAYGIAAALQRLKELGIYPDDNAIDLFLLATLVYSADTRVSRRSESQDGWTREFRLSLPVRNPKAFEAAKATLEKMLGFLSGDLWELEFRARPDVYRTIAQEPDATLPKPPFTGVSLFSGGMDSLIGAIDELEAGESPLFVGHAGDSATSGAQKACEEGLRGEYPTSAFDYFRLWLQIPKGIVVGVKSDDTTRSRSFLFIAAAMMSGAGLRKPFRLRVPENGLIALNVPLDPNRVGALSTRTTHPYYLACWKEVADLLGIDATIINPYWNATKGEMVKGCANRRLLLTLLPVSMSCSSPAKARWDGHGIQHCGYCLPCIIRRAAILEGMGPATPDPTKYTLALMNGTLDTRKSIGKQARSFQVAIERLKSRPELAKYLILKTGPLSDVADSRDELAGVYLRGMMEVERFLRPITTAPL